MQLKTIYNLEITTLSPLHIGCGDTLERDFDYAIHNSQTWVIDHDALAEVVYSRSSQEFQRFLDAVPPAQFLTPADFRPDSPLFRYVMRGAPRAAATGSAIQSHLKNPFDQPYLPGSSLKGAIRTLIFRHAFATSGKKLQPATLDNNRKTAGQTLEQELLGRDPNHDLLRALHLADSAPISADNLLVVNAQVFNARSAGAPIALEAIRSEATFHTTLTLDDYLFDDSQASQQLRLDRKRNWLTTLPVLANDQAQARLKQELQFYKTRPRSRVAGFYRQLLGLIPQLGSDRFLLQLGWGGGWDNKTLAYLVGPTEREALLKRYPRLTIGTRQKGDPFPKSRRAVAREVDGEVQPIAPFGWLLVTMTPR